MRLAAIIKSWRAGTIPLITFNGTIAASGGVAAGAMYSVLTTLTYGPTIAVDASLGNDFVFTITDNVAFVLSNPTNPPSAGLDQVIRVTYRNASGGAHGAGTFGTLYKTSAALAAVADGNSRTIAFRWNGTNWVEIWRTAADVAN